jgi:hypothetical protein
MMMMMMMYRNNPAEFHNEDPLVNTLLRHQKPFGGWGSTS